MASKPAISSDPTAIISASNSRRQPMRQARTVRKPAAGTKPGGRGGTTNGVNGQSISSLAPPAKFYPALSQFTDAIDALPAEAIRHFTLLCEVDAKACGPEANLRFLIESAKSLPAPEDPYEYDPALDALKKLDELQQQRDDFHVSREASMLLHQLETAQASEGPGSRTILGHPETRRARFAQIRAQITDLLKTQDEKIHVISTAHEALQKHLQRIEHTYGCVQMEIPDLYRLGSAEHWAYKDPIKRGTAAAQARAAERAQREAEERHNQREIETSNTRSETRREARQKAAAAAAAATAAMNEEEEQLQGDQNHQHQQHLQPAKKLHGNSKIRKEQEALASAKRLAEHQSAAGGGGLVPASGSGIPPQQPKRRKTNNTAREPSASVDKALTGEPSSRVIPSPRVGTPSAANRKGKSGASTAGSRGGRRIPEIGRRLTTRTSRNPGGPAASPSLASSPIHSTFPVSAGLGRDVTLSITGKSPDKQQDPLSSRSTDWAKLASGSKVKKDKEKEKDGSKDEDKAIASGAPGREGRSAVPASDTRDTTLTGKFPENLRHSVSEDADMAGAGEKPFKPFMFQPTDGGPKGVIPVSGASSPEKSTKRRKESIPSTEVMDDLPALDLEKPPRRDGDKKLVTEANEKEKKRKRSIQDGHDKSPVSAPPTMIGEKHARSYHSTTTSVKARPSTSDGVPTQPMQTPPGARRQQRKRADSSAAAMSNTKMKVEELDEEDPPAVEDDADADAEEDADEDEPVYCYCQQISYGEMVACDGENCPKEWFHLACAGLAQAPRGKAKWYCNDCKDSMTRGRRLGSKT